MRLLNERAPRAEVTVLSLACAVAGVVSLGTAAVPFSETAPTRMAAALGVVALALAAVLRATADRVPRAALHAVLVVATVAVSACVGASTTPAGPGVTAWSFLWVTLYAAVFLSRPALLAHLGLVVVGLAVGLHLAGAPSGPQTWGFVAVALGTVAGVVHGLVGRLREQAHRDPLTGLLTRTAFATAAAQAVAESRRSGADLCVAVIDLDGFKAVNDRDGHAAGDELLVRLATGWRRTLRGGDVLGRHGGDEFVLLMPGTGVERAGEVLGRLRAAVPEGRWTAGVAAWRGQTLTGWLADADADLYARKRARGSEPEAAVPVRPTGSGRRGGSAASAAGGGELGPQR